MTAPVALSRVAVQEGEWVADRGQVETQESVRAVAWVRAVSDRAAAWALAGLVRVAAWGLGPPEVAGVS